MKNKASNLGEGPSSDQDEALSFPLSIIAWCSNLCSKTTSSRGGQTPRSSIATNEEPGEAIEESDEAIEESDEAIETKAEESGEDIETKAEESNVEDAVTTLEEFVENKSESSQPAENNSETVSPSA